MKNKEIFRFLSVYKILPCCIKVVWYKNINLHVQSYTQCLYSFFYIPFFHNYCHFFIDTFDMYIIISNLVYLQGHQDDCKWSCVTQVVERSHVHASIERLLHVSVSKPSVMTLLDWYWMRSLIYESKFTCSFITLCGISKLKTSMIWRIF